MFKNHQFILF